MKSTILGLVTLAIVITAAQAQPAQDTSAASTNKSAANTAINPDARSSFQARLQNIVGRAAAFTRLEAMEDRWGGVIIRRSARAGSVSGQGRVDVTCIAFSDTRTNQTEYGIRVDVTPASKTAETRMAYVDFDDIAPLLKGIDSIGRIDMSASPFSDIEAAYKTGGGLRIAAPPGGAGKFQVSVPLERHRAATVTLTSAQFAQFRGLLESAKTTLDSARKDKGR